VEHTSRIDELSSASELSSTTAPEYQLVASLRPISGLDDLSQSNERGVLRKRKRRSVEHPAVAHIPEQNRTLSTLPTQHTVEPDCTQPVDGSNTQEVTRRLQSNLGRVPQRKPDYAGTEPILLPASLDNLVTGIWEQIYSSTSFDVDAIVSF